MTQPQLSTERLLLRAFRYDDLDPLADFFADPVATQFIGGTQTRVQSHARLTGYAGEWTLCGRGLWAVEDRATRALAGFAGYLNPPDWPEPEIGWSIFPAYQRQGYAPEAAAEALRALYAIGVEAPLVSYIHPENRASIRVAEKLGASPERRIELRGGPAMVWRHRAAKSMGGRAA